MKQLVWATVVFAGLIYFLATFFDELDDADSHEEFEELDEEENRW